MGLHCSVQSHLTPLSLEEDGKFDANGMTGNPSPSQCLTSTMHTINKYCSAGWYMYVCMYACTISQALYSSSRTLREIQHCGHYIQFITLEIEGKNYIITQSTAQKISVLTEALLWFSFSSSLVAEVPGQVYLPQMMTVSLPDCLLAVHSVTEFVPDQMFVYAVLSVGCSTIVHMCGIVRTIPTADPCMLLNF